MPQLIVGSYKDITVVIEVGKVCEEQIQALVLPEGSACFMFEILIEVSTVVKSCESIIGG